MRFITSNIAFSSQHSAPDHLREPQALREQKDLCFTAEEEKEISVYQRSSAAKSKSVCRIAVWDFTRMIRG
jgi:hypothetical protein